MNSQDSRDEVNRYWQDHSLTSDYYVPNAALFRIFAEFRVDLRGCTVVEHGFGANRGADLIECRRRGATIFGTDISNKFVEEFAAENPEVSVLAVDVGVDRPDFGTTIDLAYCANLVYYLQEQQIKNFFSFTWEQLRTGGIFVVQSIELERELRPNNQLREFWSWRQYGDTAEIPVGQNVAPNPIQPLSCDSLIEFAVSVGFSLRGVKATAESYGQRSPFLRAEQYFVFEKC